MIYKIDINSEWRFQNSKYLSSKTDAILGDQQMLIRNFMIMNIINFLFPWGCIGVILIYLLKNMEFDNSITYFIYGSLVLILCYLLYSIFVNIYKKITLYECGLIIQDRKKKITVIYSEITQVEINKGFYRKQSTMKNWLGSAIPITKMTIVLKNGFSVSFTSEEFYNAEKKINKFIRTINSEV